MPASEVDALIEKTLNGDREALSELLDRYRPRLRAMVNFRMDPRVRKRVDPSDILQESFIELARKLPTAKLPQDPSSFFVWIRGITMDRLLVAHRRHLAAKVRDARKELSIDQKFGGDATSMCLAAGLLGKETSILGKIVRREQKQLVISLLEQMDGIEREVIALRTFEGLSNSEVAQILNLTKQKASRIFIRGLERLRASMQSIPGLAEQI
ncbi:MAG: sigma-70 family RNA polymerase sigma factor [Pirellulaceae bacterium]